MTIEIDLIFKIAAVGIIVSVLNQVLTRSGREEQATMTTLAGLVDAGLIERYETDDLDKVLAAIHALPSKKD